MQKFEEQTAEPAADARVTAQELARAVAMLEARKEAVSQHDAETIPLGEAVRQLGLSVTPAELLAEIQAHREAMNAEVRRPSKPLTLLKLALTACLLLVSLSFGLRLLTVLRESPALEITDVSASLSNGSRIRLLDVPDNRPVYTDLGTVYELNHGKPVEKISVGSEQSLDGQDGSRHWWELVKLNGKLYVRGWASGGPLSANGREANFFSRRYEGRPELTIRTVPIETLADILDPAMVDETYDRGHTEGILLPEENAP